MIRERYSWRNVFCRSLIMSSSVLSFCRAGYLIYYKSITTGRPVNRLWKSRRPSGSLLFDVFDRPVDFVALQHPVLVEIGDDRFHERLRETKRALLVAKIIDQDRECQ